MGVMMVKTLFYVIAILHIIALPLNVQASEPNKKYAPGGFYSMPIRFGLRACGADIAKLCDNIMPGGGRIAQCLKDQKKDLSTACRNFVDYGSSLRKAFFACNADASKYCSHIRPGGGRIISCLKGEKEKISEICNGALSQIESDYGQ